MKISAILAAVENGGFDKTFVSLYRDTVRPRARYGKLLADFLERYGDREGLLFSVPGRTEISGNHTDHNNGCVLAASVDIDIIAVAAKTEGMTVRIKSEGYPEDTVDCTSPDPKKVRKGSSSALVTGICDAFARKGYAFGGFDACTSSDVLTGSGLSSSAAFEVMCARIMSQLYNEGKVPPMELAMAGQYAENVYFGKPCGLMDQTASAVGNLVTIDFFEAGKPVIEPVDFDFGSCGHALCIIDSGADHADLTDEYAAVPGEMKAVAAYLGKDVLTQAEEAEFYAAIPQIRKACGDRAVMRAIHFYQENARVPQQVAALREGDFQKFLSLVKQSGYSSYMYLQNVIPAGYKAHQDVAVALALCEHYLQGKGAYRVHGGGFAGTVQAFVPYDILDSFVAGIDGALGAGACHVLSIRPQGGVRMELKQ